ncbi:HD domain-containing protein [Diplocarpon rosae]|nr:HD domain-containing protein [Diplocarpon rosae]
MYSGSESDSGSEREPDQNSTNKKRGRPQVAPLEPFKDEIIRLFSDEEVPIIEIARRMNLEHGLDISERTISRRLTQWEVPRKNTRTPASQELQDRIAFHYNKNLNDDQIARALFAEGFEIKPRNLARLRQKLGMRRRSKYPEFREHSEEGGDDGESAARAPRPSPKKVRLRKKKAPLNAALIPKVTAFVETYMSKYDGSHDFNHVKRVVGLAHRIYAEITKSEEESGLFERESSLDLQVVTLAALLHDVGDKKYLQPGRTRETLVLATLLGFGAPEDLALKVQRIVLAVSYSSEIKDPGHVESMISKYPELAIVQDADRLDAIGAVGIGRTFTFGGAMNAKDMGETMQHFNDKLVRLESMMKTGPGKKLARERTERLEIFMGWWEEEQKEAEGLLRRKS